MSGGRSSRSGRSRVVEEESIGHASTSFVPISLADLNHYKKLLTLNEIQMNAIVPVFERYLPRARAVVSASHNSRDPEEDTYNWLPSDSSVRELTELDAGIFELLSTVRSADSHNDYLRSLQAIRRRQLLTHKTAISGAGEVDVANVLYHSGLSNDARLALDDLVEEYNESAESLFVARFQAFRKILDLQTLGGSDSELSQAWDARRGFQRQLARLNLDTVQRALGVLAPEDRDALQRAFDRAAFGRVLHDPLVAGGLIRRATELRDLNQQQRELIASVDEDYKRSYRTLTRAMVDTLGDTIWWSSDEHGELWPGGTSQRVSALRTFRFDRQQLNELVRLTLRTILSKDQFKLIRDRP